MILLLGMIAALYFAREILIPLAFALILTFVLPPVVELLHRLRIARVRSVILAILVTMASAGCAGWIIAKQVVDVANQLPKYRQNFHAKIVALHIPTEGSLGVEASSVKEISRELSIPEEPSPAPILRCGIRSSAVRRALPGFLSPYRSCKRRQMA